MAVAPGNLTSPPLPLSLKAGARRPSSDGPRKRLTWGESLHELHWEFPLRTPGEGDAGLFQLAVQCNGHGQLVRLRLSFAVDEAAAIESPLDLADHHLHQRLTQYFLRGEPLGEIGWQRLDTEGWSTFQRAVYASIARIPHGETRTYGWVARQVGKGTATRAVGQALRKNPLPIIVPCHRVVSTDSLGGFMGSDDPGEVELALKRRLLELEESYRNPAFAFIEPRWRGRPTVA